MASSKLSLLFGTIHEVRSRSKLQTDLEENSVGKRITHFIKFGCYDFAWTTPCGRVVYNNQRRSSRGHRPVKRRLAINIDYLHGQRIALPRRGSGVSEACSAEECSRERHCPGHDSHDEEDGKSIHGAKLFQLA